MNPKELKYLKWHFTKLHASDWLLWLGISPPILVALVAVVLTLFNPTATRVTLAILYSVLVAIVIAHPEWGFFHQHQLDKAFHQKLRKIGK